MWEPGPCTHRRACRLADIPLVLLWALFSGLGYLVSYPLAETAYYKEVRLLETGMLTGRVTGAGDKRMKKQISRHKGCLACLTWAYREGSC